MTFESFVLAFSWPHAFWNVAAVLAFLLGLILTLVILIQDSQGGGLGTSFGGGGGESFLGARAQRGISKFTAILGVIFGVMILLLSRFNPDYDLSRPGDQDTRPALESPPDPGAGAGNENSGDEGGPR